MRNKQLEALKTQVDSVGKQLVGIQSVMEQKGRVSTVYLERLTDLLEGVERDISRVENSFLLFNRSSLTPISIPDKVLWDVEENGIVSGIAQFLSKVGERLSKTVIQEYLNIQSTPNIESEIVDKLSGLGKEVMSLFQSCWRPAGISPISQQKPRNTCTSRGNSPSRRKAYSRLAGRYLEPLGYKRVEQDTSDPFYNPSSFHYVRTNPRQRTESSYVVTTLQL